MTSDTNWERKLNEKHLILKPLAGWIMKQSKEGTTYAKWNLVKLPCKMLLTKYMPHWSAGINPQEESKIWRGEHIRDNMEENGKNMNNKLASLSNSLTFR